MRRRTASFHCSEPAGKIAAQEVRHPRRQRVRRKERSLDHLSPVGNWRAGDCACENVNQVSRSLERLLNQHDLPGVFEAATAFLAQLTRTSA
jgi:hypothetical protein